MIEAINSLKNKKVKEVCSLKNSKNIQDLHMFLIETNHLIEMAKDNLEYVFTLKEIECLNCKQYIVTEDILKKCSQNKSFSKVIGVVKELDFDFKLDETLVYLDNIQDPGNLGTILRTCLGLGVKNIIISEDSCSIYNFKAIQSSQGAIFKLNIKIASKEYILKLKEMGYRIVSTSLCSKSINLNKMKYKEKTCLVFGNEGRGIKEEILNISDELIIIPIKDIDSFNVGVSLGIVLYSYLLKKQLIEKAKE